MSRKTVSITDAYLAFVCGVGATIFSGLALVTQQGWIGSEWHVLTGYVAGFWTLLLFVFLHWNLQNEAEIV